MSPDTRYERANLVNAGAWAVKRVAVFGLGSMGQPLSDQFARHGVATRTPGRLRLVDGQTVDARNFIGTGYRLCHLGMSKAEAAAEIVREINPDVNLSHWRCHITDADIPAIRDMAAQTDLLCLMADSFDTMLRISDACASICPQIMAIFGPNADYAEVAFSIPGRTPTLSEILGRRRRQAISTPSALGCDTAFVANFVAAVCLELLLDPSDRGRIVRCYADAPLFVVGLRKAWLFRNDAEEIARIVACVHVDP